MTKLYSEHEARFIAHVLYRLGVEQPDRTPAQVDDFIQTLLTEAEQSRPLLDSNGPLARDVRKDSLPPF